MYLSHYNLAEKPFEISTDPRFLWLGEKHREAMAVLTYGITNNQGFVLLTGDAGTGKTTLINALVKSLHDDTIVAVIWDPKIDRPEFCNLIASAFSMKKQFKEKLDFTVYFTHFLKDAYKDNNKVLLIIDEAQNISLDFLEEIRLLSNIEIPERKLLNVFLVGQNEFNNFLIREECRSLKQRITITHNIQPLTESETGKYIRHRLKVAGTENEIFNKKAIRKIYSFSRGYPRLTNVICDHALLSGYVKELTTITPKIIKECVKELRQPGKITKSKHPELKLPLKKFRKRALVSFCLLFLVVLFAYPFTSTQHKYLLTNFKSFFAQLFQKTAATAYSPITLNPEDFKLTIPFDYKSNELPKSIYAVLDKRAAIMLQNPGITIVIKGYTDSLGSYAYNKGLSEFRANMVKSYLVGRGISPARIRAIGMGEENPLKPNTTEEGRKANRRVEFELIGHNSKQMVRAKIPEPPVE
jgi:type II secretory pathway predicted ATPase ExeA/outer membrane protein OmpA-like peptidoglycan-associated protein